VRVWRDRWAGLCCSARLDPACTCVARESNSPSWPSRGGLCAGGLGRACFMLTRPPRTACPALSPGRGRLGWRGRDGRAGLGWYGGGDDLAVLLWGTSLAGQVTRHAGSMWSCCVEAVLALGWLLAYRGEALLGSCHTVWLSCVGLRLILGSCHGGVLGLWVLVQGLSGHLSYALPVVEWRGLCVHRGFPARLVLSSLGVEWPRGLMA